MLGQTFGISVLEILPGNGYLHQPPGGGAQARSQHDQHADETFDGGIALIQAPMSDAHRRVLQEWGRV